MKTIYITSILFGLLTATLSLPAQALIPARTTVEVEKQALVSFGATVRKVNDGTASDGAVEFLDSTDRGQSLVITTPVLPASAYQVQFRYKSNIKRGTAVITIDDSPAAFPGVSEVDEFGPAGYKTVTLGRFIFVRTGTHAIKITVGDKNPASAGYLLTADAFIFLPEISSDIRTGVAIDTTGSGPFSVTMVSFPSDASIRYTIDGTAPTPTHGKLYTGPVLVKPPATVSARAFKMGLDDSAVATVNYTDKPGFFLKASPTRLTAVEGESATSIFTFTPYNGFSGPIAFSTIGLETFATASFTPVVINGGPVTSILTVGALPAGRDLLGLPISVAAQGTNGVTERVFVSLRNLQRRLGEAEDIPHSIAGAPLTVHADVDTSGAKWVSLDALSAGPFAEFTLQNVPAGTYAVKLSYIADQNRGVARFAVDGVPLGEPLDQYAEAPAHVDNIFGTLTFAAAGNHVMRLTVVGKNPASSGFTLSADRFTLPPTLTLEAEALPASSPSATLITISADSRASGGNLVFMNAKTVGDSVGFDTPVIPDGTYKIKLRYKADVDRGQALFVVDGEVVGTVDQHAASAAYVTADVGVVKLRSFVNGGGSRRIEFSVQGKNPASKKFTLTADSIIFVGQ